MAVRTRFEPIERDIDLILKQELSSEARQKRLVAFARERRAEADAVNVRAFGYLPRAEIFVDGVRDVPLERVSADGVVVFQFDLLGEMLAWIDFMLLMHSPVKSGRYKRSHLLFMDGVVVDPSDRHLEGRVFTYTNTQPYARKIEGDAGTGKPPLSKQAPDGVFQAVAALGQQRFGNIGRFRFTYTSIVGGGRDDRQPCITVTV